MVQKFHRWHITWLSTWGSLNERTNKSKEVTITALPIGTSTDSYKLFVLEPMLNDGVITDYEKNHTNTTVHVAFNFAPGERNRLNNQEGSLFRAFKMETSISTKIQALDKDSCLRRYENVNGILTDFYKLRHEYYIKRKNYLVGILTAEVARLNEQARFITEKCNNILIIENKTCEEVIDQLIKGDYRANPVEEWKKKIAQANEQVRFDFEWSYFPHCIAQIQMLMFVC